MRKHNCQGSLVIRAGHDTATPFNWAFFSGGDHYSEGVLSADNPLPTRSENDRTVLLLPASRVLFCRIMPEHQTKRQSVQSLLWQIESELFTEAESLHGVILLQDEEGHYHIAAVDREWLGSLLADLKQMGVTVDAVHPDVMALPCGTAVKLNEEWLVRYDTTAGLCVPDNNLSVLWRTINVESPVHCLSSPLPDIDGWQAEPERSAMALMVTGAPDTPGLLSGEFQSELAVSKTVGFKSLVITSLLSLFLLITLPLFEGLYQQYQARKLNTTAHQLIRSYYPGVPDNIVPKVWLERKLHNRQTPSVTLGLHTMLQENYDFLQSISCGRVEGFFWDSQQQKLVLNIVDAPDDLLDVVNAHSAAGMIISAKPDVEKNVTDVSMTRITQ
ncbi:type II secretion system protein GspL [Erwinia psidii]|uniref:GspL cytoplasmic actin-ATPase-like domain-containing protein n=1 Tax=Erwinia psidii TaxID=69224 RepID=A0A3N6SHN0_9GAMM|nr:type II secretion system protein GspL [Erwinia psidii]MCX8958086.1 hypothetical protein [Erwinia psidii]MCX8962486.1 hypothetical protein [Erwinia psidii]MCX8966380.1 hypothetical protein [Erwinia psidii]RQM37066.1 hypothetical protein EB241_16780 [Erwinia psidii]